MCQGDVLDPAYHVPWASYLCNLGIPSSRPWIICVWHHSLHTLLTLPSTFFIRPFLMSKACVSSPLNQVKSQRLALELLFKLTPPSRTMPFSTGFPCSPATVRCFPPCAVTTSLFSRLRLSSSCPALLSASATLSSL